MKNTEVKTNENNTEYEDRYDTLSFALKTLRHTHGYHQTFVAKTLGVSTAAYSHYECCDRIPTIIHLIKLSNLYNLNLSYLILIACIDIAKRRDMGADEVFRAFTHDRSLPQNEACILSKCSRLSSSNMQNLHLFLDVAADCSRTERTGMPFSRTVNADSK